MYLLSVFSLICLIKTVTFKCHVVVKGQLS